MPTKPLEKRVETLEMVVMGPGGVIEQLGELRGEVRELRTEFLHFRDETRAEFSAVRQEMAAEFASVRLELRAGDQETRTYMLVLHEELRGLIETLGEGLNVRPKKSRRPK